MSIFSRVEVFDTFEETTLRVLASPELFIIMLGLGASTLDRYSEDPLTGGVDTLERGMNWGEGGKLG